MKKRVEKFRLKMLLIATETGSVKVGNEVEVTRSLMRSISKNLSPELVILKDITDELRSGTNGILNDGKYMYNGVVYEKYVMSI